MALKRSQKAVTQDPDVILRIGKISNFTSARGEKETTLEIYHEGNVRCILKGWRFGERKFDTVEDKKKAMQTVPMIINISKSRPNVLIRKQDNVSESRINEVIAFLSQMENFLNMSDPTQYDRFSELAIGPKAGADWFFEDMRATRQLKTSANEDTIEIGAKLHAMKGNEKALRDALFLIGESPSKTDTAEELYFLLSSAVIDDPKSETRRAFMKYFVHPEMNPKEKEIQLWLNKAVSFGVVENRAGFLVFGNERLGVSDREAIEKLLYENDLYKSLKVGVSNKSGMKEDIEEANKVVSVVNGTADEARALAYVSNLMKDNGLAKAPHMILRGVDTLEGAVAKYNEKAKEVGLTAKDFITVDGIMAEIGG
jgi:hypothetical protein